VAYTLILYVHLLCYVYVWQLLVDVERSLPLDLEDHSSAIGCLLERFAREQDAVVRAKIVSLLRQLGKAPGLKAEDLAVNIMRMMKTESMSLLFHLFSFHSWYVKCLRCYWFCGCCLDRSLNCSLKPKLGLRQIKQKDKVKKRNLSNALK